MYVRGVSLRHWWVVQTVVALTHAVGTANTCRRYYLGVLDLGGSVQTSVALTTTAISYGVAISCAHVINKYTRAADDKQNKPAAAAQRLT